MALSGNCLGDIEMIYGCMFAGKTGYLINRLDRCTSMDGQENRVLLICSEIAQRGDATQKGILTTHRKIPGYIGGKIDEIVIGRLVEIEDSVIYQYDVIGIDEAQFFPDILEVLKWAEKGIDIYTAGLLATSEGNFFGSYYKLLPFAVHCQLFAHCVDCFNQAKENWGRGIYVDAVATTCTVEKKTAIMTGSSFYKPVCLKHWKVANSSSN
jgi:thymidine kinase